MAFYTFLWQEDETELVEEDEGKNQYKINFSVDWRGNEWNLKLDGNFCDPKSI